MVTAGEGTEVGELNLPDPFRIVSIKSVVTPSGLSGSEWHRYEICQGSNSIVGYRAGSTESVREAVEMIVVGLNHRRRNRRGRVHVVLQSAAKAGLQ
jgi:hypothetical protein